VAATRVGYRADRTFFLFSETGAGVPDCNMNSPVEFSRDAEGECRHLIELALNEDLGSTEHSLQRDITSCSVVPEHVTGRADFVARNRGVLCGIVVCQRILELVERDLAIDVHLTDGSPVESGQSIATISGNARSILLVERTCLNFLGRLSGIATLTGQYVRQVAGTAARVLDTRKTTPGWRNLEKYAVACGGGINHRMGLFDAVLIKDNHLALMDLLTDEPLAEIRQAIVAARQWISENAETLPDGRKTTVEIEVDHLDQFRQALAEKPDIILLDNMSCDQLRSAVELRNASGTAILLEASGGVNLHSIREIAGTGVDRISVGALTHSAVNFDIGLDWQLD
jgi:nicotinate-nucleotide pyrophosphorylase (carboxylating)